MGEKKRILYIDLMKGLSITWVVWFHTTHPSFVDYGFRMPLFFIASAIFFKPYPLKVFLEKKIYQMIIPFVLFYVIYYLFMLASDVFSAETVSHFNYSCILDVIKPYVGNGGPTVNPPLWFIMALLDLQLLLYVSVKIVKSRLLLMIASLAVSIVATLYLFDMSTYFQFGRALRYFCYYTFGYLYGKDIIKIIEGKRKDSIKLFCVTAFVFTIAIGLKQIFNSGNSVAIIDYFQITSLVVLLIYLFKYAQDWIVLKPLKYYGANSYIVLGMNEMILTSLKVLFLHYLGTISIMTGFIHWILTLVLLIPVIKFMNKYIPWLVGKQNIFDTYLNKLKIAKV